MTYYERPNYIKIDDAIRVIERAADKRWIDNKTAEMIIHDLYHETDINKYHKPKLN